MITSDTNTEHGRKAVPFARALWDQMHDRSEIERRYLFDLLQVELGLATMTGKKEVAAEALSRFVDARVSEKARVATDETVARWARGELSRRNYDEFRAEQPSPREWPSASYIRNAFDNDWNAAIAAIGHKPGVDVTSRQLTASAKPFSREEVLAALRIWISDVDQEDGPGSRLLQARYESWTRSKRAAEDLRFSRLPRASTLHRVIGDWQEVLAALGCAHRHWTARARSSVGDDGAARSFKEVAEILDLSTAPPDMPRKHRYADDSPRAVNDHADLTISWVRWLGEQLPAAERASLRMEDFIRYMSSIRRLSLAQGKPLRPPSHASIERSPEIGGWLHAKHLAGLIEERVVVKQSTKPFAEPELVDAIMAAIREVGPDMTRADYTEWKERQDHRLPSASTLRRSLSDTGSWTKAVETAIRLDRERGRQDGEQTREQRKAA